jgi:hypothetical protein
MEQSADLINDSTLFSSTNDPEAFNPERITTILSLEELHYICQAIDCHLDAVPDERQKIVEEGILEAFIPVLAEYHPAWVKRIEGKGDNAQSNA